MAKSAPKKSKSAGKADVSNVKKAAARKATPATKAKPARSQPTRVSGGYEIICSECYSAFRFAPAHAGSGLECPDCLHRGQAADSDVMTKIALAKSAERSWLVKASIPLILFFVVGISYGALLTLKSASDQVLGSTVHYGFLGGGTILLILLVWFAVKYETSRADVYF